MITGNPVAGILPITVGAGSKIKFEWSQVCSGPTCSKIYLPNTHDVMEMADLDHYTRCDFTGAKAQGTAEENAARSVTLTMPTPANAEAVQYYACSVGKGFGGGHCAQGQKITVTIMKDPDNCGVDKYCYKVRTSAGDNGDGIDPGYAPEATCVDTPKTKSCELSTDDGGNKILTDACMCCKDKECWHPASGFVGDNCGGSLGKGNICKKKKEPHPVNATPHRQNVNLLPTPGLVFVLLPTVSIVHRNCQRRMIVRKKLERHGPRRYRSVQTMVAKSTTQETKMTFVQELRVPDL